MNLIENVFLTGDCLENQSLQKTRIKMGEVFQLQNERYALVCIHCSEEFQYFSEFTLHVQEHFERMNLPKEEQFPVAAEFIKTEIHLEDDTPKIVEITGDTQVAVEMDIIDPTLVSVSVSELKKVKNTNTIDKTNENFKENLKVPKESSDDDFNDFMNDCENGDSDVDTDHKVIQSTSIDTKEIVLKDVEETNRTRQVKKQPKKKSPLTSRPKQPKPVKRILKPNEVSQNYENLLQRFTNSTEDPLDPVKFEIFKAEKVDRLFPSTIKDTPEVRLMATLSAHTYKYEKVGRDFLCPICRNQFPNAASVRRHLFTHIKEPVFLCGFCPEKFRAIRYLRNHLNTKHNDEPRSFECFLCHKEFTQNQFRTLREHIQTHLIETMHCMLCNKKFKEFCFYQLHMMNLHPNGIQLKNETQVTQPISYREKPIITTFECYLCKKNFRERRLLRSHTKLHIQQPRLCLVCGIFCSSATSLSRHMKLHSSDETKSHICTICGKGFKIRQYLLRHRRKEHQLWADNTQPMCQICGTYFNKKSLLHEHMKTHPFEETRNFICTICNHAARNAYNLKRHLETHSSDRSYECPICHKTFHPRYAKDHIKSHTGSRKYKCQDCGKKFKRKYALKQHSYQHGGAPEHKCDICGRAFARTDKLLRHRRRHGIPLNYHCKICQKGFISEKSYLLHESGHMKSQSNEPQTSEASNVEFIENN